MILRRDVPEGASFFAGTPATQGAFYMFPCIRSIGMSSEEFCETLLQEEKVAVVPGNAFGESGEGFVRVSYAYSLKHLQEALVRIERFVNRHRGE